MLDCNKDTKNSKESTLSFFEIGNNDNNIKITDDDTMSDGNTTIQIDSPVSIKSIKSKITKNNSVNKNLIKLKSNGFTKSEIIRLNDIRPERPWDGNLESYAFTQLSIKERDKVFHNSAGRFFNKKFLVWGFLSMVIPIIMSTVSMAVNETDSAYKYVNSIAFLATGVVGLIVSFCKFKGKATAHFISATQISSFIYEYDSELKKPKEHRMKASVYQTKLTDNLERLSREEPLLPKHIENETTNICNHLFC
jgi:hypothetical protein